MIELPRRTQPFKTAPRDYFLCLSGVFVKRWWWIIALPPASLFVLAWALHDLRFAILALMYIFICLPGMATFVWFDNVLRPQARLSTLTRIVEFNPGKNIVISFPENPEDKDITIPWEDLDDIDKKHKLLAVYPKSHIRDVILIPLEALEPPKDEEPTEKQ